MAFLVPVFTAATGAIGGIGSALGLVGTGLSAYSSIQQGKAAAAAANYNAKVKDQQAATENQQAAARATEYATRTRQKQASIRAGAVQSGLETSGSVNDIITAVGEQGMLDQLTSLYDGGLRAAGLRTSARLDRAEARGARSAGLLGALSNITSGVSGYLE
jgi:hypothetical protein